MNRPTIITVAAALAVSLLLAACGGDDDSGGTGTPSPTINTSLDAATVQEFRDLTAKWADASAKITFNLVSNAGGVPAGAKVVVYRKAPDVRLDHSSTAKTTIVIVRPEVGYSCTDVARSCAQLSPADAAAAAEFVPFVGPLADSAGVDAIINGATKMEQAEDQEVAGRAVKCIDVSGDLGGLPGEATFCFTEDGLPLSIGYDGGAQALQLTATAIEEAKDSDFEPPYIVPTLPPTGTPAATP